nr:hypothetical protein [Tanacetum cinerariifolium]
METTIEQQTALDESLVPSSQRAFQVTADVPKIYMQEFWATAKLHHNSIRFKIDTRKNVLDLEAFREMLHISPRIPNQPFADLPTVARVARNIATTIEQQTALDESIVPSTQRLRIGRSNFRLPSDIQSKEATLQVIYDVLRNSLLFRAFHVTADVPEIYMQVFWATAKLHHNSIRFKIDTRKSGLDLEAFREMLSPRIPNQPFADLPTEDVILDFLRFLGHNHDIRYLTDVNVNKLYQPWRSFASVINKCLTGKSSGVDIELSQMELKKILIEKMEENKSIQRSDEQRNLYKALAKAYEADKSILDTYSDSSILKRRKEDDDQEGPSAGPNRGSKRQKEGGEQASASTPSEKATRGASGSTTGRIITVTELQIMEWHDYKHLDWISVRRDDDQIYKFKEGDFKRLRLQDIEDMLLLLEHCHPEARGRPSTGSGKLPEEAQPDEARHDKKNRLMRIDELHKFSDETLNDVRNALDDSLKGLRMQYLPSTIWRKGDKDRAAAMIQAIEKMLKTRRIMRSLEKFVGGRLYEGDLRML